MDETKLIEKYLSPLTKNFKESLFLKDDAAILKKTHKKKIVSMDNFIHGVHCPDNLAPNLSVARAILVAISDLAAMASLPYCMFISISLPRKEGLEKMKKISNGISWAITHTKLRLLGGDLCTYDGPLSYCVTVVGIENKKILKRKGAKAGDFLIVSGTIGDSKLGLDCIEKRIKKLSSIDKKKAIKRFLVPPLRHEFACLISPYVKSCIDISDGLVLDAGKLAKNSNCGLNIASDKTPLSRLVKKTLKNNIYSIEQIISAGDDYELAFAVEKKNILKVKKIAASKRIKVSIIGHFTKENGVYVDNQRFTNGYSHF